MKINKTSITCLVVLMIPLAASVLLQSCNKKNAPKPGQVIPPISAPKPPVSIPDPHTYIVSTLAGDSAAGYVNGSAARFNNPAGISIDSYGNLYVADVFNNHIRRVSQTGLVTTRESNDWSPAQFMYPLGLAVNASGDIYVCDTYNHRISKIAFNSGIVTTFAGGKQGFKDGKGTDARFSYPGGIAFDANGNAYVTDTNNSSIRKITPDGQVTTFAGSGKYGYTNGQGAIAKFADPSGIAIDAGGAIYIADVNNNAIRKITATGIVSTLAGDGTPGMIDGPISGARFFKPMGVATDAAGNVYVADTWNQRIRMINPAGTVTTLAGSDAGFADGAGAIARFNLPRGIVVDTVGNIFIGDQLNNRIRQLKIIN